MTDEERLKLINENWGNYPTETTKGMTALCLDFEWLLEQAEKAQRYEKTLEDITKIGYSNKFGGGWTYTGENHAKCMGKAMEALGKHF